MAADGYYTDLNKFSIMEMKDLLQHVRLLPSQQILREEIHHRFACLQQHGIENLAQLQRALKTKTNITSFALQTGLPVDYLTILRREVNSYHPKPISLRDFPGVNQLTLKYIQLSLKLVHIG